KRDWSSDVCSSDLWYVPICLHRNCSTPTDRSSPDFSSVPCFSNNRTSRVLDRQRQSRLLADSVRRTLEEPHSEQELHSAWPKITALIDHLVGRAHAALNHYRTTRRD